jgi:serine/threonine protein kinase
MEEGSLYLVMEYLKGGDLFTRLHANYKPRGIHLPEAEVWRASLHLIKAVGLLHGAGVCHRDIKSQNVFLGARGEYVLGDFNVAKVTQDQLMETQTGTPYYASPEVWSMHPYSTKSDVWSLGCLIYEMCAHNPPFTGQKV